MTLRKHLEAHFNALADEAVGRIVSVVRAAVSQEHGTLVVITSEATEEASRLADESFPLTPCELSGSALRALSNMDGAVLLDDAGLCHAVGVILDGETTSDGLPADAGRGARYNSAVRYVNTARRAGRAVVAVVFSEDGNVDLL